MIYKRDKNYPVLLKKIGKQAPKALYFKGSWDNEIFENCLAVVGSRRMTHYGQEAIERIVGEAALAGLTIVSGFMYGCDAQAHRTALKFGARTVAVMPCGIDRIHPEYQQDLYRDILNNKGLIISEYQGNAPPFLWTYPRRNRIVAGLSKAVLVIEASQSSGSLITTDWARKFGRKIFAVPGPITSENFKGILQLLKEGAEPVDSAEQILQFFKINFKFQNSKIGSKFKIKHPKFIEDEILEKLRLEALAVDELARVFKKSASEMGAVLSMMELRGSIKQQGNKYYLC